MRHTSRTLVGREAELGECSAWLGLDASARGAEFERAARILLSGDAGVGKTRLLRTLGELAPAHGWQVLAGHCLDFGDSALPYLPFSEILGRLDGSEPEVVARVAEIHPALGRLQRGRRAVGSLDDEGQALDRAALFEAVHALIEEAASVAPVLLIVEDLHWADQSTRDMVSFLFTRAFAGRVGLVASYRSDDLHRRHPLRRQVSEWSRLSHVQRMALSPLTDDAVRALVDELVPAGIGPAELDRIVDRAEGNAFFVEELANAAASPGSRVPTDLADALLVRLDRLDDDARAVVRAASASGRLVEHDLLVAASGLTQSALESGLRTAVEMNVLLARGGTYTFRHALLGEAVYDDLLPGERVRLHADYVAALQSGIADGTSAELARHARLANDLDTALDASIRAGHEASAVGGPDEAAAHYQQALELLADPGRCANADVDVSKLVVSAAEALTASGEPERAAALIADQLARLGADAPTMWRARLLSAHANALSIIDSELDPLAISEQAVALAPEGDSALRARVLANHARILTGYGRYDEAQAAGLDALVLAERLDLNQLVSDAITTLNVLKQSGPKEGLREALQEAISRAVGSEALEAELRGRYLLGRSYADWGEFDQAEQWLASAVDRAAAAGTPWAPYGFEARWQLALITLIRGDWERVLELTETRAGAPPVPRAMLSSVRLHVEQRRGVDVSSRAGALRVFWPREGGVAIHTSTLEMVAAGRRGDVEGVVAVYEAVVEVLTRIWHVWFTARIRLAAVALGAIAAAMPSLSAVERARTVEHATRLRDDARVVLERYAHPSGHWGPEGRAWVRRVDAEALRVRWLAGVDAPSQEALVETWRDTVDRFAEFGHVHETAAVRTTLAGILRACGDPAGAREQGDLARAAAHELGAQPLIDELIAIGSAPTQRLEASSTLTPREHEVLTLVAEGRSNGEIAQLLFISTKTVSVHVSRILAKLEATGRTEAAAIARRQGLLAP